MNDFDWTEDIEADRIHVGAKFIINKDSIWYGVRAFTGNGCGIVEITEIMSKDYGRRITYTHTLYNNDGSLEEQTKGNMLTYNIMEELVDKEYYRTYE